jgi:ATP-dependent exoDNAse (exonuclease V) beta subunit
VVAGFADLVAVTSAGFVLIDHKTFPGELEVALERIRDYSGQLAAYAAAIEAATGLAPAGLWIHLPILGAAAPLRI